MRLSERDKRVLSLSRAERMRAGNCPCGGSDEMCPCQNVARTQDPRGCDSGRRIEPVFNDDE